MDFHYHPILGLQYSFDLFSIEIDVCAFPEMSVSEVLNLVFQQGIVFENSLGQGALKKRKIITHNLIQSCGTT